MTGPVASPDTASTGNDRARTTRARALDWLIGAAGMLLVLVLLAGILWIALSRPAGDAPESPVTSGPGTTPSAAPTPARTPPPGLRTDEVWLGDIALDSGAVVAAGTLLRDVRATGVDVTSGEDGISAARLVLDTGIHAKGWSREQAIAYMRETVGLPQGAAENEIDRYVVWPGQACGYKIGHTEIDRMRTKARTALGARFDIKGFHDAVLLGGGLPLAVLEQVVDDWAHARA